MKILICSKLFYPSNRIGAVRPSNFAKFLALAGHEVVVVTDRKEVEKELNFSNIEIIRISNGPLCRKAIKKITKSTLKRKEEQDFKKDTESTPNSKFGCLLKSIIGKIRYKLRELYSLTIDLDWYYRARQYIKVHFQSSTFDLVLSSYGPLSSYLLGRLVKKERIAHYWISDFRDNMVFDGYSLWLNEIMRYCEKRALKEANALTFVSNDQRSMFIENLKVIELQQSKIFTIYNGYERKLSRNLIKDANSNILKLMYTGQLYKGMRDFQLLFHAVDDLIEEGQLDKERIEIQYAGMDTKELKRQVNNFRHIKSIYKSFGFINRSEAVELQKNCNILVVLTWNTIKSRGNLTGKFLEYLQAQKPVVSITSGDLQNSELTRLVRELNIGLACEQISYQSDYFKLKKFILDQYKQLTKGNDIHFYPNYELLDKFYYENIVKELLIVINSITKK